MAKKPKKSAAKLERIAQDKITAIRRVLLGDAGNGGPPANGSSMKSREIETVVFESLQARKALKRLRRTQANGVRKPGLGK